MHAPSQGVTAQMKLRPGEFAPATHHMYDLGPCLNLHEVRIHVLLRVHERKCTCTAWGPA